MATEDSTPASPATPELSISLNPSPPTTFAPHKMTVSYTGPTTTPYLRLRGHWLEKAGFPVGTPVRVEVSERRLVVEAVEREEPPHCAEPNCPHETKKKKKERRPGSGW